MKPTYFSKSLKHFKVWRTILACSLLPEIEDRQNLCSLHNHKLFKIGLAIRISLVIAAFPLIREQLFIPFMTSANYNLDPWHSYLASGGNQIAFPYGIIMYIAYFPLAKLGWVLDQLNKSNQLSSLGFGITTLIYDYSLLIAIAVLARKYSIKLLLAAYWCCPVVIYILYYHGQLDVLPVFLLVSGLCFLQINRPRVAGVLLGLATSAKFSMITALPFFCIYLVRNRRLRHDLGRLLAAYLLTFALCILPFLESDAYSQMVLLTPVSDRIYNVYLDYGEGLSVFLLPAVYIVTLYLVWRLERITLDLFVISVGIGFFALLLFLPPAPGWFLWVIPFFVFYQLRSQAQGDYLLTTLPFYGIYLIFNVLYSSGSSFPSLGVELDEPLAQLIWFDSLRFKSLLFTGQQACGLLVCIRMYIFGITRNNYYRRGRRPLVVGITGRPGVGKTRLSNSISRLLGECSVSEISGNKYLKWELDHPAWNNKRRFDPHANNLSRLTHDVLSLDEGKAIRSSRFDPQNRTFKMRHMIHSTDYVIVSGLHTFYTSRLRNRIDLKIFLDCDDALREYWKNEAKRVEQSESDEERNASDREIQPDEQRYIYLQEKYADLSFKLCMLNPDVSRNIAKNEAEPRLKLHVRMDNGFCHEELSRCLIALCGMHIDWLQSSGLDYIDICLEGDISNEDLDQIARLLIPNLEDLILPDPLWDNGLIGLMQVITLIHISDSLHRQSRSQHA
jgi:uridine kinase